MAEPTVAGGFLGEVVHLSPENSFVALDFLHIGLLLNIYFAIFRVCCFSKENLSKFVWSEDPESFRSYKFPYKGI